MKFVRCKWSAVALTVTVAFGNFAVAQESTQKVSRVLPVRLNETPTDPSATILPPVPPGLVARSAPAQPPSPAPVSVPPAPVAPAQPTPPPPSQLSESIIAWDAPQKDCTVTFGELSASFTFYFTNVSPEEVTLNSVGTSCGCTVAQLPPLPWKLLPGTNGAVPVTMNLAGKNGVVFKSVTVNTDKGQKTLIVKVNIQPRPDPVTDRMQNQEIAKADRQAVFKGECAKCHVEKARDKSGKELYAAACGICHEAEHRATMVANLHALEHDTSPEYWRTWIAHGKPGTLMPAFARSEGGPLSDWEINSIVQYLTTAIPPRGAAHAGRSATAN